MAYPIFKINDEVIVNDPGLIKLMELMKSFGEDVKPNNIGFIREFIDKDTALIEFPIGDDDIKEHSQVAPYPISLLELKNKTSIETNPRDIISIWCPLHESELQTVEDMAAVGFSADKICMNLQRQKRLFLRDFKTEGTPIHSAYNRGLMSAQMETDNVTLENAKKGNLTAKQQMEKKWEEQRIENIKNELFNT